MWSTPPPPSRAKKCHQEPIPGAIYDHRNENFYLMHTLASPCTDVPSMIVQKTEWVHFHPVGPQCIKIVKKKKKKNTFSSLKNSVHVEPVWFGLDNLTLCAALTTAQWYCTRLKKISDALKLFSYERDDFLLVFLKYRDKLSTKLKKFR